MDDNQLIDDLEIRRNGGLAALVAMAAAAVAFAYLLRAGTTNSAVDWALFAAMALLGLWQVGALIDARTPLLIADEQGVRIRLGREWRGIPWASLEQVVVEERHGPLRDGRLVLAPRNVDSALADLDPRSLRAVKAMQRLYGAPLAVPLGLTTRSNSTELRADLLELADGRAEIVELAGAEFANLTPVPKRPVAEVPEPEAEPEADTDSDPGTGTGAEPEAGADAGTAPVRLSPIGSIATLVSRWGHGRDHDVDAETAEESESESESEVPAAAAREAAVEETPQEAAQEAARETAPKTAETAAEPRRPFRLDPVAPLRATRDAVRAEITRDTPASVGNVALSRDPREREAARDLPEVAELRRPTGDDAVDLGGHVRAVTRPGELVIDDFAVAPVADPIIGPRIAVARERLNLSIDVLSERTRIRPHVLEAIEVDDFTPCGGDFYARGHLRTLARVLGIDGAPLEAEFDARYAHAPINARRVFEAELATGMSGGIRAAAGGPRWSLLVGAVMALVLVWGVARLFATPAEEFDVNAPVLSDSAGLSANQKPITSPQMAVATIALNAKGGASKVVVRDRNGKIVFTGTVEDGASQRIAGLAPFSVEAEHADKISVSSKGQDLGTVGSADVRTTRNFG